MRYAFSGLGSIFVVALLNTVVTATLTFLKSFDLTLSNK